MSRTERRNGFQEEHRIRLLEGDVDDIVSSAAADRNELKAEIEALRATLGGIRNVLIGGLVSFTTASLLLAANLVLGG